MTARVSSSLEVSKNFKFSYSRGAWLRHASVYIFFADTHTQRYGLYGTRVGKFANVAGIYTSTNGGMSQRNGQEKNTEQRQSGIIRVWALIRAAEFHTDLARGWLSFFCVPVTRVRARPDISESERETYIHTRAHMQRILIRTVRSREISIDARGVGRNIVTRAHHIDMRSANLFWPSWRDGILEDNVQSWW